MKSIKPYSKAYFAREQIRVQIPAYTDAWMRGDRTGVIVSSRTLKLLDPRSCTIVQVKMDVSGKTLAVYLDDCTKVPAKIEGVSA